MLGCIHKTTIGRWDAEWNGAGQVPGQLLPTAPAITPKREEVGGWLAWAGGRWLPRVAPHAAMVVKMSMMPNNQLDDDNNFNECNSEENWVMGQRELAEKENEVKKFALDFRIADS